MKNNPKKHTILLMFALVIMLLLALGVHVLAGHTNFGIAFARSGTFENIHQNIHSTGWTFSAYEANGNNTIFAILNQDNLDNFSLKSSIENGVVVLTIRNGEISQSFDLNAGRLEMSSSDIDMNQFTPGRIEFTLTFTNAINASIEVEW